MKKTMQPDGPSPQSTPAQPSLSEAIAMALIGLDWGERRLGLAVKPAGFDYAMPGAVIETANEAAAIAALNRRIEESGAQGVVVGLPVHPDPEIGRRIRRFCRKARRNRSGVRWFFVDERFTSEAAQSISHEAGHSRRPVDDVAASLILETFLQSCR